LDEHITLLEEAAKRDHRNIGLQQDLFHVNPLSPGSAFMFPKGQVLYNKLTELIKN
jgi:threonyl-tRNA synthetase